MTGKKSYSPTPHVRTALPKDTHRLGAKIAHPTSNDEVKEVLSSTSYKRSNQRIIP
jgi:hypothetical protein